MRIYCRTPEEISKTDKGEDIQIEPRWVLRANSFIVDAGTRKLKFTISVIVTFVQMLHLRYLKVESLSIGASMDPSSPSTSAVSRGPSNQPRVREQPISHSRRSWRTKYMSSWDTRSMLTGFGSQPECLVGKTQRHGMRAKVHQAQFLTTMLLRIIIKSNIAHTLGDREMTPSAWSLRGYYRPLYDLEQYRMTHIDNSNLYTRQYGNLCLNVIPLSQATNTETKEQPCVKSVSLSVPPSTKQKKKQERGVDRSFVNYFNSTLVFYP